MSQLRILHVAAALNRGGTEACLMQLMRRFDRERFPMDFLVFSDREGPYDQEIREHGSRILRCPPPRHAVQFSHAFHALVSEYGPYDIVHSHIYFMNGFVLKVAAEAGIPVRIAHSHMTGEDKHAGPVRHLYRRLMKHWIHQCSTFGLGCSEAAAEALFGSDWREHPKYQVFYCGIDLSAFDRPTDPGLRRQFGLPEDALVVGHVGRFEPQKNHRFLIEIAKRTIELAPHVRFLLIGDGPLKAETMALAESYGIADHIVFPGVQANIEHLMNSCMDVFLLPSVHEGLPMVGLEAQASGLPCLFSASITTELRVLPSATFLPLSDSADTWARELMRLASLPRMPVTEATSAMRDAGFCDASAAKRLASLYTFAAARSSAVA